jgi:hypothetical protein
MPLGTETIARRQGLRGKEHLWLDTGGFSGGVLIDEYANRYDRAFDKVYEHSDTKEVSDAPLIMQHEYYAAREGYYKHSPMHKRMRLDDSIYTNNPKGAEEQIARETDFSIRAERARAWFSIMERIARFRGETRSPTVLTLPGE